MKQAREKQRKQLRFEGASLPCGAKCIAIVGPAGSRKTDVARVLQTAGWILISPGRIYREQSRTAVSLPELLMAVLRSRQRAGGLLALKQAFKEAPDDLLAGETRVVVDGVRSFDELAYLRQRFGEVVILGCWASPETRRAFMFKHPDSEVQNRDDALALDYFECLLGAGSLFYMADRMVILPDADCDDQQIVAAVQSALEGIPGFEI